jgi:hypothetical protein
MFDVLFLPSCFPHSKNLPGLGKRLLNEEIRKAGTAWHRRQRPNVAAPLLEKPEVRGQKSEISFPRLGKKFRASEKISHG